MIAVADVIKQMSALMTHSYLLARVLTQILTHTHTDDGWMDGRMREVKKTIEIRMTSGVTINSVYTHQLLILFTKGC